MKNQWQITLKNTLFRLAIVMALLSLSLGTITAAPAWAIDVNDSMTAPGAQDADTPPQGLSTDAWASMQDLLRQAQYQFTWQVDEGEWAYRAPNPANNLALSLAADGLRAARYSAEGQLLWDFGLSLAAYGEQTFPTAIAEDSLIGDRDRVAYHWSQDVLEWYSNRADGLEHGLTLAAPPAGPEGSTVELTFALGGSLTPEMDDNGNTLFLKDASNQTVLRYDQLAVYDAAGRPLPAYMRLVDGGQFAHLQLVIDDAGAAYPLTVDPILHDKEIKLTASDAEEYDRFGASVAISGDTVVVGAFGENGLGTARGAAYVFTRNQGGSGDGWGEVVKISAAPLQDNAAFGWSVAISEDTLVVGAPYEDNVGVGDCVTGENCGAVYIFERNKNGKDMWGQVKRLTADNSAEETAHFGRSVAISSDTIVVGAPFKNGFGGSDRGAAYVFERNRGGADQWGRVEILTSDTPQDDANFGSSVGISEDTIVVGATHEDSAGLTDTGAAYIFVRNEGGLDKWDQVARLAASGAQAEDRFGISVAISGDTVVVGAIGVDDVGNGACLAGTDCGAAYVFERNQGGADGWGRVAKLAASDADAYDYFGWSVAIRGDTLVVGAIYDNDGGPNSGTAYLFERNQGGADNWGQLRKLSASDAETGDEFGHSVAISDNAVIVGASSKDGSEDRNRGAAYVFVAGGGQWPQIGISRAADAQNNDQYGFSVAVSGDSAVIGAKAEDGTGTNRGAAYIIERNENGADNWGQVTRLTPSDPGDDDTFGNSVAISGDTVVIGAQGWDGPDGEDDENQGATYIFERNQGGADNWGQVARLNAEDLGIYADEQNDYFGFSVAISGDTIIVGALYEDSCYGICDDEGAAYIFARNKGGDDHWGQLRKLTASDKDDYDKFGSSVAISGDTAVVGAWGEDGAVVDSDRGAAYVFKRNYQFSNPSTPLADSWGQIAKLEASNPDDNDRFGISAAISNDTIVVGAYWEDGFAIGDTERGAAYIFERNKDGTSTAADNWGYVKKLSASDAQDQDYFGRSVSISGDLVIVGAYGEDGIGLTTDDKGAAYVFERNYLPSNPSTSFADNWGQMAKLTASQPANNDFFGYAVAISGDTIVVGAYLDDYGIGTINDPPTDRGSAYIYYRWALSPEIEVSPGALDFGNQGVDAGSTPPQTVTITNEGTDDLNISSISLGGANPYQFDFGNDSGETILAPGATRSLEISFDPSSEGAKSATLSIGSDDPDEATVNVAISGNGVALLQEITVSPSSLDFGDQEVDAGPTPPRMVTITNDGTADLQITSVGLTGADPTAFMIQSDSGETTLTPGSSRSVAITFDPSSAGAKSATLRITSDDGDEPVVDVALSGNDGSSSNSNYVYLPLVSNKD